MDGTMNLFYSDGQMSYMSILIAVCISLIALSFLISLISAFICFIFRKVKRSLVEGVIALIITGCFSWSNFDSWLEGGRSFGRGLGTESRIPVIIITLMMLVITFIISNLVVRLGRLYGRKKRKGESGAKTKVAGAEGGGVRSEHSILTANPPSRGAEGGCGSEESNP